VATGSLVAGCGVQGKPQEMPAQPAVQAQHDGTYLGAEGSGAPDEDDDEFFLPVCTVLTKPGACWHCLSSQHTSISSSTTQQVLPPCTVHQHSDRELPTTGMCCCMPDSSSACGVSICSNPT
jgi:hypothetical protein